MNEKINKRFEFPIIWYDWNTSCRIKIRPVTENDYLKDAIIGVPDCPEITECNLSSKAIRKLNGIHP